jgi:hypothetical protein
MTLTESGVTLTRPRPIAPSGLPMQPPSPEQAKAAMELYQEISNALLTPDDVQDISTRKERRTFPKRSAFQKLANAYRVSTEIVSEQIDYDDDGKIVRARYRVRATHPDGRSTEGTGACAASEDRFKTNAGKIDHDLPATAETRAKNRAISDLVAFGAVSAEEAESEPGAARALGGVPPWAAPVNDIAGVAQSLVSLLKLAGVEDAEAATRATNIGNAVFEDCESTVPLCVARVINFISGEILNANDGEIVTPAPDEPTDENETTNDQ